MLYPIPGATGAPDGNFTMVTTNVTSLTLTAGAQSIALPSPGPAPTPMPSPAATPFFQSETFQGEAVPALQPATTYTALDQRGARSICNPPENLGTFTTR